MLIFCFWNMEIDSVDGKQSCTTKRMFETLPKSWDVYHLLTGARFLLSTVLNNDTHTFYTTLSVIAYATWLQFGWRKWSPSEFTLSGEQPSSHPSIHPCCFFSGKVDKSGDVLFSFSTACWLNTWENTGVIAHLRNEQLLFFWVCLNI